MSQDNLMENDQKSEIAQNTPKKHEEKYIKKLIAICLAFTYCIFVTGMVFSGITVTHKFEGKNNVANLKIEHSLDYRSRFKFDIEHGWKYNSPLELRIDNAGVSSLPFKIEVKDSRR